MSFRAECPHCGAGFSAEDHFEGKRGKCSKCGERFVVERITIPPEEPADTFRFSDSEEFFAAAKNTADPDDQGTTETPGIPSSKRRKFLSEPSSRNFYTLKLFADFYLFAAGALVVLGIIVSIINIINERDLIAFYKEQIPEIKKELEALEDDKFGIMRSGLEARLERYENSLEGLPTYTWLWIFLGAISSGLGCLFIRELIHLGLAIESNTRASAGGMVISPGAQ